VQDGGGCPRHAGNSNDGGNVEIDLIRSIEHRHSLFCKIRVVGQNELQSSTYDYTDFKSRAAEQHSFGYTKRLYMSLLPSPSSAKDLLVKRRRGRRLEPIYQQTLSAPIHFHRGDLFMDRISYSN
jgi:hypothetical protein